VNLLLFRVFLLPIDQHLWAAQGKERDITLLEKAFRLGAERFTFEGSNFVIDPVRDENILLGGKLGKLARRRMPVLREGHLDRTHFELHPYVVFLWLREKQILAIQKNTSIFPNPLRPVRVLESYINGRLFPEGLEIKSNPLTEENFFWTTLGNAVNVFEVSFSLPAPNFFGRSKQETKTILEAIVSDTNANVVDASVKNDQGALDIKREGRVQHAVELTEEGGGTWSVRLLLKGEHRPRRVRSRDKTRQISIGIEWDDSKAEEFKRINIDVSNRVS
jgi:hypothetical protein